MRRDPTDLDEWEFKMKKQVEWDEEEAKKEHKAEAQGKIDAVQWMKIKGESSGSQEEGSAAQALGAVLPGKKVKASKAGSNAEEASDGDGQNSGDKDEDQAEKLSQVGGSSEAKEKITQMLKLIGKVKSEVGAKQQKFLKEPEAALKGMEKKKVSLEVAREKLIDCALAIKKAKSLQ